jgi:hypothetical protein
LTFHSQIFESRRIYTGTHTFWAGSVYVPAEEGVTVVSFSDVW